MQSCLSTLLLTWKILLISLKFLKLLTSTYLYTVSILTVSRYMLHQVIIFCGLSVCLPLSGIQPHKRKCNFLGCPSLTPNNCTNFDKKILNQFRTSTQVTYTIRLEKTKWHLDIRCHSIITHNKLNFLMTNERDIASIVLTSPVNLSTQRFIY